MSERAAELIERINSLKTECRLLQQELEYELGGKPAPKRPAISDHALLRYIERVKGFDLNPIREELLTPERRELIKSGVSCIAGDGYEIVVANGIMITVIEGRKYK